MTDNASPEYDLAMERIAAAPLRFPVVGMGASAGGVDALLTFFENMPDDNGMAFVVVLHLSAEHESNLSEILQRVTRMRVRQVHGSVSIEPNNVYVIPPSKNLSMRDTHLETSDANRAAGKQVAIDLFLRTLADTHRQRAVCIILSGTGSDGAVGIGSIKEQGGLTFAQEPADAAHDGMPRAAIETGCADVVLAAADMPARLMALAANAAAIVLPDADEMDIKAEFDTAGRGQAEVALARVMALLHERTGHDFAHYKRATILRRIERRLQVNGLAGLAAYNDFLLRNESETPLLLQDMLIGVTNFFRDSDAFEVLEHDVVPRLFEAAGDGGEVRAWVAGCATGEEAYSIAMLLAEYRIQQPDAERASYQVFASDIDERAIGVGRRGIYPLSIEADVPPLRLRQFFTSEGNHHRIRKEVRERLLFVAHNILRDPPFSRVHLICCRNLLIYLNREVQEKIFEMFHFALAPGGYLFLGSSESAEVASRYFTPIDKKNRIYRATASLRSPHMGIQAYRQPYQASAPLAEASRQNGKASYGDIHFRLLERYAPPSVLINRDADILHLSENAGKYLRYAGGEPTHNLLQLILPELRLELRTTLYQVGRANASMEARGVHLQRGAAAAKVSMTVHPMSGESGAESLLLVLFTEVAEVSAEARDQAGEAVDNRVMLAVNQLEGELKRTREQLQSTIEEHETSAEELKASNEELQAINEELRSATEELETSREELQAINEELITVNLELKLKVEETAKSNDDLQNFVTATGVATIFIDRAKRIKRFTPRATELFNLIASDLDRPLLDITHRLEYDSLEEDANDVFRTLRMIEREMRSDAGHWYIARMVPYRTLDDRIEGLVLSFIDVTSLHQARRSLYEGEQRMRLVAASTRDYAIITLDPDGCITSWNSGAQRMFGWSESDALGQDAAIIFTPEDRENGVPQQEMLTATTEGRAEDERWHIRKDGTRFFCSGVTTPLDDGEWHGFAKIARDLTGNKIAESRHSAALADEMAGRMAAEDASRLRDEFLAVLSHELKQPLNLIHLNAELLKRIPESRGSEAIARIADTIRETAISEAQIIDDLLDLSRVRTGKLTLNRSNIDFGRILTRICEAFRSDADAKQITFNQDAIASVTINGDVTRIEQIIWNLLSNAVKFTPHGGAVRVGITVDGAMACLRVSDNGRGIDADALPHVFEMFHQAESSTTRQHGGLGIGLALVRQLAESHGGSAEAYSAGAGRGAEFRVWLPIGPLSPVGEHTPPDDEDHAVLDGMRILLVDDEPAILQSFGELLKMYGVLVCGAGSAAEALVEAKRQKFDLIVSDIAMPEADGYSLLAELRKLPGMASVPVIAVTGFGRINDVERALTAGFIAHLKKPIAIDVLARTIRAIMPARQT